MKALLYVPLAVAVGLASVALVVFGLGDRETLVPPPEAVVEGFVRELETGRYERATAYLGEELSGRVGAEQLEGWTRRLLERTGDVLDVEGVPGWHTDARAEAYAVLTTERAGEPRLRFTLAREQGVWKINGLTSLEAAELEAR